jgi:hypothetical protein
VVLFDTYPICRLFLFILLGHKISSAKK